MPHLPKVCVSTLRKLKHGSISAERHYCRKGDNRPTARSDLYVAPHMVGEHDYLSQSRTFPGMGFLKDCA